MRYRRLLVVTIMAGSLVVGSAGAAFAGNVAPGPEFGKHVSKMAPEHPQMFGRMFGECVSAMARGEAHNDACSHDHN